MSKPEFKLFIKEINLDYLSRESVRQQKGIYAILVLLYHMAISIGFRPILYVARGDYVVAFFFFFSGYGLMTRFLTAKEYKKGFLRRRILPILVVYLGVNVLYWIVDVFLGRVRTLKSVLINFFKYGEPEARYSWYVVSILFFYLFFYLSINIAKNKRVVILLMSVTWVFFCVGIYLIGWGRHWFDTSILLIIGLIWAAYEQTIQKIIYKLYPIVIVAVYMLNRYSARVRGIFAVTSKKRIGVDTVFIITLTLMVVLITMKVKINIPILGFLGDMSLEIYICQGLILNILAVLDIKNNMACATLFTIAGTLILAYGIRTIRRKLFNGKIRVRTQ